MQKIFKKKTDIVVSFACVTRQESSDRMLTKSKNQLLLICKMYHFQNKHVIQALYTRLKIKCEKDSYAIFKQ